MVNRPTFLFSKFFSISYGFRVMAHFDWKNTNSQFSSPKHQNFKKTTQTKRCFLGNLPTLLFSLMVFGCRNSKFFKKFSKFFQKLPRFYNVFKFLSWKCQCPTVENPGNLSKIVKKWIFCSKMSKSTNFSKHFSKMA